ncbi:YybS family protein [Indiicoccus explosivorum]|uniref:YybS family protein n=1 Tax=Indiicoccus explosivorum TaxID=1917864 RepID=UPI000B43E402|nr:YybS family protein [Indiicoccus explosivorum]
MMNNRTKKITHGAMMAAVFVVLTAASVYVPVLNIVSALFLPVPIAWYSATYGARASALFAAAAALLTFVVGGIAALPLALLFIPFGLAVGLSIHAKKSKLFLFMSAAMALLIATLVEYAGAMLLLEINFLMEPIDRLREAGEAIGSRSEELGGLPEGYGAWLADTVHTLEMMLPSAFILSVFLLAWLLLLADLPILGRMGLNVPKFPPFRGMKLPKSILWYYLVVLLSPYLFNFEEGTLAYSAVLNASVILQVLLFLQGVSFYHYYIHQQGWPKWSAVLATFLAVPLAGFTGIVGIIDLGFNIRGLVKQADESKRK